MSTTEETADVPAGKVWICPACGARYDAPTTCSAQHPPEECNEYDLAPITNVVEPEPGPAPEPAPADALPVEPAPVETAPAEPAPEAPSPTLDTVKAVFADFDAAYQDLKTKLGL